MPDLADRVALITGGGRGIGRAVARALADAGAKVAVAGRTEAQLAEVARETGGRAYVSDVSNPAAMQALAERVRKDLGTVDLLVPNAGVGRSTPVARETLEGWDEVIGVNLRGTFLTIRAFLSDMIARRRGRIVCVASVAGKVGFKYAAAYSASKHGVLGLVRSLALEVAAEGITVNAICPGWTETDLATAAVGNIAKKSGRSTEEAHASLAAMSPQGRFMTPEEVAGVVRFLCTDAAAGVTGQAWNVDGGQVMV